MKKFFFIFNVVDKLHCEYTFFIIFDVPAQLQSEYKIIITLMYLMSYMKNKIIFIFKVFYKLHEN